MKRFLKFLIRLGAAYLLAGAVYLMYYRWPHYAGHGQHEQSSPLERRVNAPAGDAIVREARDDEEIGQPPERRRSGGHDARKPCDCRCQEGERGQQHQTFVRLTLSPEVQRGTDEHRKDDEIPKRNDQKCERRRAPWRRETTARRRDRGHGADDQHRDGQDAADHAKAPMKRRAATGNQPRLNDEQDDPAAENQAMCSVPRQVRSLASAERQAVRCSGCVFLPYAR